ATDGALSASDDVVFNVTNLPPANRAPVVNAGPDQTVAFPASALLAGTASDDGVPGPLTISWSKVSGPGTATFVNPTPAATTVTFSDAGTYTLRLTATDSTLTTNDDVVITSAGATNRAPVVNAGPDQTIVSPASASLAGSATDDGYPTGSTM